MRYALLVTLVFALHCSDPLQGPAAPRDSGQGPDAAIGADAGGEGPQGGLDGSRRPGDAAGDAKPAPTGPLVVYASGYGPNIATFSLDPATGALASKGSVVASTGNPSFLAVNPTATNLYAVSEIAGGRVAAYAIDPASGALTALNDVSSKGNGPAHVSVDATGKWVFVANYGDGTVAVLPAQPGGGRLGDASDAQSVGANAHMAASDPSNGFVFVPCKGADYVAQFTLDVVNGKLVPNTPARVATAAGAGPRHIAFHPNGRLAYLINELKSTMSAYAMDTNGRLTEIETKSTLPVGFVGQNTGAEVGVHAGGKLVFGSNRGHDSIVAFAIDEATGKMTLKGHTKTGGATPRDFTLDPTGVFLYAANQDSSTVVPFRIDAVQGTLAPVASPVSVASVAFVGVVRLPAP